MTGFGLNDVALLILRLGAAALLFAGHGWPKITHFAERAATFADPIGVGSTVSLGLVVFAEVFCSVLVTLGLLTRVAVIPVLIFFVIALFHHAPDPWAKKELVLIFALPFLAILIAGPGRISVDEVRERGRTRKAMMLGR
jgi:putative oxidoreductase